MVKKKPRLFYTEAEANAAGYDIVLREPVRIDSSSELARKSKLLILYDAYLVRFSERGVGARDIYPLLKWGKDIKSIGAHPNYDIQTQEY